MWHLEAALLQEISVTKHKVHHKQFSILFKKKEGNKVVRLPHTPNSEARCSSADIASSGCGTVYAATPFYNITSRLGSY